jgi:hypothetical protein
MAQPYILPNRKAFADSIVRIFRMYRDKTIDPLDTADSEEDLCMRQGDMSRNSRELFSYQKIVRDYLLIETPYRGLLLYHGLGSGKTCSSIAVAESLMTTKKAFVLLPASLQDNYRKEISKCGDPIYTMSQHWRVVSLRDAVDREVPRGMGISDKFLDENGRYFVTIPDRPSNFNDLPLDVQKGVRSQIDDILNQRFTFINYNGITKSNIDKIIPPDQPDMFNNSVVIIDEAHNLIGNVVNEREAKRKLYDMIYNAKECKVVCLSGTPVINRPNEIAFLMNLLRGPIERVTVPMKQAISWDEGMMTGFFKGLKDVDTVEYNSTKRSVLLTRNPPRFESVYTDKGERIAVKYNKDFEQDPDIKKWVLSWKEKFETQFGGTELAEEDKFIVEKLECLPTNFEEFMNTFVDGLSIKNPLLLGRRIQGLVSYFKGADERLLPKRIDEESTLVKVPMSPEQFLRYLQARWIEVQSESRKRLQTNSNEEYGNYRMTSRLVCNYALPEEFEKKTARDLKLATETSKLTSPEILEALIRQPEKYLSEAGLASFSPKMLRMLKDIKSQIGEPGKFKNQFIYSQYTALEGLGVFGAVLEANGFQRYKFIKEGPLYREDPSMKPGVPAYAFFTGEESEEERDIYRQIFNEDYDQTFPQSLKDSIKEKRLSVLMASSAGAEGIDLKNVRNVYILEAYWNPARIEQVIGRAIRVCSHAKLPTPDRTVKVQLYLTVFSPEQSTTQEGPNIVPIRRADMVLKRYDGGEPRESFMTSDEFLYEVAYEKGRIIKNISLILKQSAIDCEIHRKLHAKETPVIQCMRFDTTTGPEDLAFKPSYLADERDTLYMRNIIKRKARRLQKIKAKGIGLLLDPDTNEIFDLPSFEDTQRLIKLGIRTAPGEIRFFTSVVS